MVPIIKISPPLNWTACDLAIQSLSDYDWLIFTSVNGVQFFLNRLHQEKAPPFKGKIAVLGKKTLTELEKYGWKTDMMPQLFSSRGLIEEFRKLDIAGKRILIPTSHIAGDELSEKLKNRGAVVNRLSVYRTMPANVSDKKNVLDDIKNNSINAIIFYIIQHFFFV